MPHEENDILKSGYIKLKRKNIGQWRKVYVILKRASFQGQQRLEKFKTDKVADESGKVISLEHVDSVMKLPKEIKESAVCINFTDGTSRMFACDSDYDASEWLDLLNKVCLKDPTYQGEIPEIKDTYHVKLLPAQNLDVSGECRMQITSDSLHLFDIYDQQKCLVTWPLNCIRKYGWDETKFTIETGRFCATGEGIFFFRTTEGEKIHNKVHAATLAIATLNSSSNAMNRSLVQTRSLPSPPHERPFLAQQSLSIPDDRLPSSPPTPPPRPDLILPPFPVHRSTAPLHVHKPQQNGAANIHQVEDTNFTYNCTDDDIPTEMAPPSPSIYDTSTADQIHRSLNRPVPATNNNNKEEKDEEDIEYIYEEKYLAKDFRKFLKFRKDDEDQ